MSLVNAAVCVEECLQEIYINQWEKERIKIMLRLMVLLLSCLLLLSCASKEEKELKKFVVDYNKTLQKVYKTADMDLLSQVAMEREIGKMFPVILAMRKFNSIMPTEIKKFKIKDVKLSPKNDKAEVETDELWEYWWEDKDTKLITKQKYQEKYHLRYYIVMNNGKWKVDRIELIEEKKK